MPSNSLNEFDYESIAQRTTEKLERRFEKFWVPSEKHYNDHKLLDLLAKEREEERAFKRRVTHSALLYVVPLVVLWAVSSLGKAVIELIKTHL